MHINRRLQLIRRTHNLCNMRRSPFLRFCSNSTAMPSTPAKLRCSNTSKHLHNMFDKLLHLVWRMLLETTWLRYNGLYKRDAIQSFLHCMSHRIPHRRYLLLRGHWFLHDLRDDWPQRMCNMSNDVRAFDWRVVVLAPQRWILKRMRENRRTRELLAMRRI